MTRARRCARGVEYSSCAPVSELGPWSSMLLADLLDLRKRTHFATTAPPAEEVDGLLVNLDVRLLESWNMSKTEQLAVVRRRCSGAAVSDGSQ